MIESILFSFFSCFVLTIWFQTNAFAEYLFFLPVVKKYNLAKKLNVATTFLNFLSINYDSFFVRLISCPYCVNFWINLFLSYFIGWKFFGLLYILSILQYKIIVILSKYESR